MPAASMATPPVAAMAMNLRRDWRGGVSLEEVAVPGGALCMDYKPLVNRSTRSR